MVARKDAGIIMLFAVLVSSGCMANASQEDKFCNKTTGDYIIFSHTTANTGSFSTHQSTGDNPSGTFTETSEAYSVTYNDPMKYGFGDTVQKKGDDEIITPIGETWVRV